MIRSLLLFSLLSLAIGCSTPAKEKVAEKVDVNTFSTKLESLKDVQLVDVRTPEEYAGGSIKNAMNMNFHGADFDQQLRTLDKSKPVMVFCQAGVPEGRSGQTMAKLKEMGFEEIYELDGGYLGWSGQ